MSDDDLEIIAVSNLKAKSRPKIGKQTLTKQQPLSQWISSSFGGFDDFATSQQIKPSSLSKAHTDPTHSSRKRPRENPTNLHQSRKSSSKSELWSEKHSPKSQADLAVHKKKVSEVSEWLQLNGQKGSILLLTGPSGAGKTATIDVLSKELGFEVHEWANPFQSAYQDSFIESLGQGRAYDPDLPAYESQAKQFKDFILRANKYNKLQIFDGCQEQSKIIFVEDFPNSFFRDATVFHELLRKYSKIGRCPLIFIVSDTTRGDSNERKLFPVSLKDELHITTISFNPIAITSMTKTLRKISTVESTDGNSEFRMPESNVLESLSMSSAGDIRSAINALQFACLQGAVKGLFSKKNNSTARGKKSKQEKHSLNTDKEACSIGARDTSLFLFRALGRILYCKRDDPANYPDLQELPPHLQSQHRDPLQVVPEEVAEKCHLSPECFNAFLHQNYIEFFQEIEDLTQASEYLSDSDFLTVEWSSRKVLEEYAVSVATRGLMQANSSRGRFHQDGSKPSGLGWKPLHKPQMYTVSKQSSSRSEDAQYLFRNWHYSPMILKTELLPYLNMLDTTMHDPDQITFIQDLVRFPKHHFGLRINPEKLDEKDVVEEIENSEEVTLNSGEAKAEVCETQNISNSQSKIKSCNNIEEEEEIEISDYDDEDIF